MEHATTDLGKVVLNEPQRRHFAVLLGMLEETLREVERMASGGATAGLSRPSSTTCRRSLPLLITSVMRVEDSTSDKLRGYGAVHPSVARAVDPVVREIHDGLAAVAAELEPRRPKKGE